MESEGKENSQGLKRSMELIGKLPSLTSTVGASPPLPPPHLILLQPSFERFPLGQSELRSRYTGCCFSKACSTYGFFSPIYVFAGRPFLWILIKVSAAHQGLPNLPTWRPLQVPEFTVSLCLLLCPPLFPIITGQKYVDLIQKTNWISRAEIVFFPLFNL